MVRNKHNFGKMLGLLICVIFVATLLIGNSEAYADSELRAGWKQSDMLKSLKLDESWVYESLGVMFWQLVYDQFWILDGPPEYNAKLMALDSFETEDNKKYRFHIREDMFFHDGKPVTAHDAAFSMEYITKAGPAWNYVDTETVEDSIVVIDDYTLDFELKTVLGAGGKYPPFQVRKIFPKHLWEKYKDNMFEYENDQCIGSGAFKLKEFKEGQYIVFERFKNHWDKSPRVDKIVWKSYGSNDGLNMALKHDEIDMFGYNGISPLALKYFEKEKNIKIIESPGITTTWITFNLHRNGPLKDISVRQAIAHGIDKNHLSKIVYHGYATPHDSFIYPELYEYNPNLKKYNFDPVAANKILDEKGYIDSDKNGIRNDPETKKDLEFKLMISSDIAEYTKIGTVLREDLKEIGISIALNVVENSTFSDLYYTPTGDEFDMAIGNGDAGPYALWIWEYMRSFDGGGEGWNTSYYNNPDFDKVLDAAYAETDKEKYKKLSFQLQEMLNEDLPNLVLLRPVQLDPVRTDRLDGFVTSMGGISSWINPHSYLYVHEK
ncbi:MAG: ABC transporter substrate-binding protein [Desulfobacterales bacterium]|nr:ABC transporter substrate-binding protein [Desulfobacterales bacterium]